MKLKYEDIGQVELTEKSTEKNLKRYFNRTLQKLLQNDKSLDPTNDITPQIWKCEWYNQPRSDKLSINYGYEKGYAVWINTESETEFIQSRIDEISSIVSQNGTFQYTFNKIKDDETKKMRLFKDIVNGTQSGGPYGEPLYYLGTLSDRIQIRISKKNHNIDTPDVSSSWEDFFDYEISSKNERRLSSCVQECISSQIQEHVLNYHLSENTIDDDQKEIINDTLQEQCVKCDILNNISSIDVQNYKSHVTKNMKLNGFDYVYKMEVEKSKTDSNAIRWYRLWASGYLEQGGIVCNGQFDTNPTVVDGKTYIKIQLKLKYDFIVESSKNFYELQQFRGKRYISQSNRYQVQCYPLLQRNLKPYSMLHDGCYYSSNDIFGMTNDSFCIKENPDCLYYSYKTSGFITSKDMFNS